MGIWERKRDRVGNALRRARPEASEDLVASLSEQVVVTAERSVRANRGSRLAFGTALVVLMVGSFASFGGLSYAASGAKSTATAVQKAVAPAKAERKTTSAAAQYDEEKVPTPTVVKQDSPGPPTVVEEDSSGPTIRVAGQSAGPRATNDTLPFTGFGLGMTAALGSLLLLLGIVLRRREAHE